MSNIDLSKLRKAADIAAERSKGAAIQAEREALREALSVRPDHASTTLRGLVERVEILEKYLGLIPLDAESPANGKPPAKEQR